MNYHKTLHVILGVGSSYIHAEQKRLEDNAIVAVLIFPTHLGPPAFQWP